MITIVNWQYIILRWPSGGVYRVKKRTDGPPPVPDTGMDTPMGNSWTRVAPPDRMYNGERYVFAFWSITGQDISGGAGVATVEGSKTANLSVTGGAWVLNAKAYYVHEIGIGGGNHGVFIDAFDIQAGDFIADDFVDVSPDDAMKTLTVSANNGFIDTSTQIAAGAAVTIKARDPLPTAKTFAYWLELPSLLVSANPATPATIGAPTSRDIVAHRNDIIYSFAYYNELPLQVMVPPRRPEIYDPLWWLKTHWGLTPPGPDPLPWMKQFIGAVSLADAANRVEPKLKKEVLGIILKQLSETASLIKKDMNKKGK